jgi:hypothetical protein
MELLKSFCRFRIPAYLHKETLKFLSTEIPKGSVLFPLWKHEDCFPTIYEIVLDLCKKKKGWVLHDEIVAMLLNNMLIVKLVADVRVYKDIEEQEIVANMVAWFSQKITEYENGNLPLNYKQFHLIEKTYRMFDRKKIGGRYAYKLRPTPASKIIPKITEKRKAIIRNHVEMKKKKEFRKYVEALKKLNLPAEEYRKLIMKWCKEHQSR